MNDFNNQNNEKNGFELNNEQSTSCVDNSFNTQYNGGVSEQFGGGTWQDNSTISNQYANNFVSYEDIQRQINMEEKKRKEMLYEKENPKGKKSLLFKVGVIYFIVLCLFSLVRILSSYGVFKVGSPAFQLIFSSSVIQILVMFTIPFILFTAVKKQKAKDTFKDFSYKKISGKVVLLSIIAGILVFYLNGYISTMFSVVISFLGYENIPVTVTENSSATYTSLYFVLTVICSCLLPAICEETVHRGMLLGVLKRYGVGKAILISGLLFGLIHMNINQFFYATIIGWLLGVLTVFSGSIYPAMIVHFINNFMSTFSEFASYSNLDILGPSTIWGFVVSLFGVFFGGLSLVIVFALMFALLIFVVYKIYEYSKSWQVYNCIRRTNYAYFANPINLDLNGRLTPVAFQRFFKTNSVAYGTMKYLSQPGRISFWDSLDFTYSKEQQKDTLSWAFVYGSMVIGVLITVFTFVWGVL